jgi:hypothetical protein
MKSLRPVLSLLRGFVAQQHARLVRLHVSQLHPLAPTRYHLRYALRLANLERPS